MILNGETLAEAVIREVCEETTATASPSLRANADVLTSL
ncbi:hypothetical protein JZ785_00165 [Alicyclobacillus curvatus]|nr:hypothetical protein JZ785_00165 [Alicyclobacillus curvatus]